MPEEPDVSPEEEEILDRKVRNRIEAKKQREREKALKQKQESERNGTGKAKELTQS